MQLALAVVAVKDDAVEGDADDLDDDLNDDADEAPVLQAADQGVVNLLAENIGTSVVDARPTPHVLVLRVVLRVLENASRDHPHDHAEDEPGDGKHGVVSADLFSTLVAAAAVGNEDDKAGKERHAGHRKNQLLWPGVGPLRPRGHLGLSGQRLGGVENGKGRRHHGEDDERTAEVDAAESKLGHADTSLDLEIARLLLVCAAFVLL